MKDMICLFFSPTKLNRIIFLFAFSISRQSFKDHVRVWQINNSTNLVCRVLMKNGCLSFSSASWLYEYIQYSCSCSKWYYVYHPKNQMLHLKIKIHHLKYHSKTSIPTKTTPINSTDLPPNQKNELIKTPILLSQGNADKNIK